MAKVKKSSRPRLTPSQKRYNKAISNLKYRLSKLTKEGYDVKDSVKIPSFIKAGEKKYPTKNQISRLTKQFGKRELLKSKKLVKRWFESPDEPIDLDEDYDYGNDDYPRIDYTFFYTVIDKLENPRTEITEIIIAELKNLANEYGEGEVGEACRNAVDSGSNIMNEKNYDIESPESAVFLQLVADYLGKTYDEEYAEALNDTIEGATHFIIK